MLNEALLPKDERASSASATAGKAAAAADGDEEPVVDRAELNREILLAAAGLLPDDGGLAKVRVGVGGRGRAPDRSHCWIEGMI